MQIPIICLQARKTGVRMPDAIGLDFLTLTFPAEAHEVTGLSMGDMVRFLENFFGPASDSPTGGWTYRQSIDFCSGAKLLYTWATGEDRPERPEACVDLKGSALGLLSLGDLLDLLIGLKVFDVSATRVDCRWDDYAKQMFPTQIFDRHKEPGTFGPFRAPPRVLTQGDGGGSVYYGRREGGAEICIYRKDIESAGLIDAVRWEVRWFKDKAAAVLDRLCDCKTVDGLAGLIGSLISGSIDFYDVGGAGEKNLDRRRPAMWHAAIRRSLRRSAVDPGAEI